MRSVREEIDHGTVDLAWREVRGSDIVVDVVKSADALPAPLAVPHASGFTSLNLRFPYDGGGVGVALLANKTPLALEKAVVEAVWLPGAGFTWLYPVGRVRFEGPLSMQRWTDPVRNLPEDVAPYRDLIEDVTDRAGQEPDPRRTST